VYPRLFDTTREESMKSALRFFAVLAALAWSFVMPPVATKYNMT
jgi:hypothetical protein